MKSTMIIIILLLFITPVLAYDRIVQGSTVYINDTVDISGATGWATQIAYYGKYSEPSDAYPIQIYDLPGLAHTSKESQYYYWIDPAKFSKYPGMWYQYYGQIDTSTYDEHGNLAVFYVDAVKPVWINETTYTVSTSNVTIVNVTPQLPLPEKHISDYLIARGDKFNITITNQSNVWLFGRINGLYNYQSAGNGVVINESLIQGFEPGGYTVLLQTMKDPSGYFTVKFDSKTNEINYFDANTFTINKLSIDGFSPQVTLDKLVKIFPSSKDSFELKKLEVQDPSITTSRVDRIYVGGKSVLDICGYTNVAPTTKIWLVWDQDRQTPQTLPLYNFTGNALGTFDGNMRQYRIIIPFDPDNTPDGIHTITAYTAIGGYAEYDVPVISLPADSYKPNETIRYISGRNPWVPNVTVTVTIPVPGPTQIIYQQLTPSVDQIRSEAQKLVDKQNAANTADAFWVAIIILVLGVIGWFLWSVKRAWK